MSKFQLAALFISCFLLYASQSKGKPFYSSYFRPTPFISWIFATHVSSTSFFLDIKNIKKNKQTLSSGPSLTIFKIKWQTLSKNNYVISWKRIKIIILVVGFANDSIELEHKTNRIWRRVCLQRLVQVQLRM